MFTIKTLANTANSLTVEAGIPLTSSTEVTPADVIAYLELLFDGVDGYTLVDPDSAERYLEDHSECIEWGIL